MASKSLQTEHSLPAARFLLLLHFSATCTLRLLAGWSWSCLRACAWVVPSARAPFPRTSPSQRGLPRAAPLNQYNTSLPSDPNPLAYPI